MMGGTMMVRQAKKVGEDNELAIVCADQKMRMYVGCGNKCPECGKTGEFGSILKYKTEAGNWWLVCGWCGKINSAEGGYSG